MSSVTDSSEDARTVEVPVTIPSPGQCSECVRRVIESVDALDGVGSVEIDPATSRLHATLDQGAMTEADLQRAVEVAGFAVAEAIGHASWRVEGLDCPDCARTVAISVERIDGVLAADLNFASALLAVEYDHEQDPRASIEDILSSMGYGATSLGDTAQRPIAEFRLTGIDCPDCARQLAERVESVPGVSQARVDFSTARIRIGYEPGSVDADSLRKAIVGAGYGVEEVAETGTSEGATRLTSRRHEVGVLISGAAIVAGLAADALGAPATVGIIFYALAAVAGGMLVFKRAWASLRMRVLDMNVLMTIAVLGAAAIGEWREAAMVVFLFSVGGWLEARSLARTRSSIRDLMKLAPEQARVRRDGATLELAPADVDLGETMVVRPGERVALDGRVSGGDSAVDESPITGESVPVDKIAGDEVFAGSLNTSGVLEIEVTALAADTTLSRIIYLVEEAQSQRAPSQQLVDRFTRYYTPIVVVLAILVAVVPPMIGAVSGLDTGGFSEWFYRALVLLVVSCPCALVISTPVAIVSAITRATRDGVLVKGGSFLEVAPTVRAVAFDKTGTLTQGHPEVTDIESFDGVGAEELLEHAAALEADSNHPLARAVVRAAEGILLPPVTEISEQPGLGMSGRVADQRWFVGSVRMARDAGVVDAHAEEVVARLENDGRTVLLVWTDSLTGREASPAGVLGIADGVRDEAPDAVARLARGAIEETVMLTGDNERTAAAVAAAAGVSQFQARLLPHEKVEAIEELRAQHGVVAMVGDGINDAPALAAADIGIAMGAAGSDTAIETADVALMSDDLTALPRFFELGRRTVANIKQNVIFSIAVKLVVLLAAIAGFAPLWLAVFADTGVALLVILNGLRLLRPAPRTR